MKMGQGCSHGAVKTQESRRPGAWARPARDIGRTRAGDQDRQGRASSSTSDALPTESIVSRTRLEARASGEIYVKDRGKNGRMGRGKRGRPIRAPGPHVPLTTRLHVVNRRFGLDYSFPRLSPNIIEQQLFSNTLHRNINSDGRCVP
jgi:hypothetical protein